MRQRRRRWRAVLGWGAAIVILALCAGLAYGWGWVGNISNIGYRNTSPPLLTTQAGVTLSLTHSRYVTLESITLTLVNRSSAPIYLPAFTGGPYGHDRYLPNIRFYPNCLALGTEMQIAQGWQVVDQGCNSDWGCPHGPVSATFGPAVLILKPGATLQFPVYNGQNAYPLWDSGTYRFSALYSTTAFVAPSDGRWSYPLAIPHGVTLWTAPITVTAAWGYPPWYHQNEPPCPLAQ